MLKDEKRFPGLSEDSRQLLQHLREHPRAPRYTATCGHRLTPAYLERVHTYEQSLVGQTVSWPVGGYPPWLPSFVAECFREVPFYRGYGAPPIQFTDIPTTDRSDLSREIWSFIPDSQALDDLIVYATSGTTGHPLVIPSHPVVSGCYTPLVKAALTGHGVTLTAGRGQVGCILVGYQRHAYTYPSVTPQQDETGHLKLNLHPDDWRNPDDRAAFLDDCAPEIYTGDPLAFAELMRLPLTTRPKALVSTAMMLLPGLCAQLTAHFACPVVSLYSMNESGPIAVAQPQAAGTYQFLQPRLFVEILNAEGRPCAPGERGEVTLTGGLNHYLPLLRYRTNDYAALEWQGATPYLSNLEGRPPVLYYAVNGQPISTLDVTRTLQPFALPQFILRQRADHSLLLTLPPHSLDLNAVRSALFTLFGSAQMITTEETQSFTEKVIQYQSDLHAPNL